MALDWIRCNRCYMSLKSAKSENGPYSLTQCGHVFCRKCTRKVLDGNKCIECNTMGVQSLELTNPLPGAIQSIFEPFLNISDRMIFAAKFQHTQMSIAMKRLDELEKKYYGMKIAYYEKTKQFEKLKMDYTQMMNSRKNYPVQKEPGAPRTYFTPNMFMQTPDVNHNEKSHFQRLTERRHMGYQMNEGYLTDSSSASASTVRPANNDVPMTPDGLFRIPNLMRRIPRSTGSSSNTSATSGSVIPNNNMF